ncbi:MAG: hypothetical protein WDZ52_12820, partial [Pseudohongiellaceae bacterium]
MKQINSLVIILALSSLNGCTSSAPSVENADITQPATATAAPAAPTPPPPPAEIEYGSFTEDQLYEAIVSELS